MILNFFFIKLMKKKKDFRILKTTLKSVLQPTQDPEKIFNVVNNINRLKTHLLLFTKLFMIYKVNHQEELPEINRQFFKYIIQNLTGKHSVKNKENSVYLDITQFYQRDYKSTMDINEPVIDIVGYKPTLDYIVIDMVTDIHNNIQMRFKNHVKKYLYAYFDIKTRIDNLRSMLYGIELKTAKANEYRQIQKMLNSFFDYDKTLIENIPIYSDIFNETNSLNKQQLDHFLKEMKKYTDNQHQLEIQIKNLKMKYTDEKVLNKEIKKLESKNKKMSKPITKQTIMYHIQVNPQYYLKAMIKMAQFCDDKEYCILNVLPLKRSIVPGFIRLDTKTVMEKFVDNVNDRKKYRITGSIELYRDEIWTHLLRIKKKVFLDKFYNFNGSILTDGISICILQGKEATSNKSEATKTERYITDLTNTEKQIFKTKTIISIDPNKDDLIYSSSGTYKEQNLKLFRYTQNQRTKETKSRKYMKILRHEKSLQPVISQQESLLSEYSSNTCVFNKFTEYTKEKNKTNVICFDFYNNPLWRKLKFSSYVLRKKSEDNMLKNFKNQHGTPKDCVIGFGDWSNSCSKFKEPTKGKGFRKLFSDYGYNVLLIDEYRTSKKCSNCVSSVAICETFLKVKNPRPWKNETRLCHGLVKCITCKTRFNRDTNATNNIRAIVKNCLNGLDRPDYLSRKNSVSD